MALPPSANPEKIFLPSPKKPDPIEKYEKVAARPSVKDAKPSVISARYSNIP